MKDLNNLMEQLISTTDECDCNLCKRNRTFNSMLEDVTSDEAKEFFVSIYNTLDDVEFDLEMEKYTTDCN